MLYFLDKTITIRRLEEIDDNRTVYSATGTAVGYLCSWQEPSAETLQMYEGQIGDFYSVFVQIACPVQDGDQVVRDEKIYSVRDVKVMDFGATQYKRLIVVKGDA